MKAWLVKYIFSNSYGRDCNMVFVEASDKKSARAAADIKVAKWLAGNSHGAPRIREVLISRLTARSSIKPAGYNG